MSSTTRRWCRIAALVETRIERLCADHEKKPSFVRRVRSALLDRHSDDAPLRTKTIGVRRLASLHRKPRNV